MEVAGFIKTSSKRSVGEEILDTYPGIHQFAIEAVPGKPTQVRFKTLRDGLPLCVAASWWCGR